MNEYRIQSMKLLNFCGIQFLEIPEHNHNKN